MSSSISEILSEAMITRAREVFDKFDWESSGTLAMEVRRMLGENYREKKL
jgi:hypothetical protein